MSNIDRQRIEAVKTLEVLGYEFAAGAWSPPAAHRVGKAGMASEVLESLHTLLVQRADQLQGCVEGSAEAAELAAITEAVQAYEALRWPEGKIPGGKG